MTNSRSTASRSSRSLLVLAMLVLWTGLASASRKRIAVLDFDGDGAEKIQADVVKMIKRSHTVITAEKWNEAAEALNATKPTDKNLKKVARKLKIDGVVTGAVEKRRGDYIIRIKLHAGTTGALVGDQVNTKTSGTRLDGTAQSDLKDELLAPIGSLAQNRGGSAGDDEADADSDAEAEPAKPLKKGGRHPAKETADEDADAADAADEPRAKPATRKGFSTHKDREQDEATVVEDDTDADAEPVAKKVTKKPAKVEPKVVTKRPRADADADADADSTDSTDSTDEDDNPLPKKRTAKTRVAATTDSEDEAPADDEEDGGRIRKRGRSDDGDAMDSAVALSPGERAVDAVIGLSFTARRLGFNYDPDLTTKPSGYKGLPVAGVVVDAGIYPGAFSHKRGGIAENIGASVLFDKVITVSTQDAAGMKFKSSESRFALGVIARYPLTKGVVGGLLRYGKQSFDIAVGAPVPGVAYSFINPGVFVRYPVNEKILFNGSIGAMAVTNTGAIQGKTQYGGATVLGLDFDFGADYMLKSNIFARAALKVQTYGYKFKGTGDKTTNLDNDPAVDVHGARDTYIGGSVNIGYLY